MVVINWEKKGHDVFISLLKRNELYIEAISEFK